MAHLVKVTIDDDGNKKKYAKWCLVTRHGGSSRTCCTGEAFGLGESTASYNTKDAPLSKITCPECKNVINWYKSLK
jgi:hypothetical protein